MLIIAKFLLLVLFTGGLLACAQDIERTSVPTPLVQSVAQVELQQKWAANTGKGNAKLYLHLTPVPVGPYIYVMDAVGHLSAFNRHNGSLYWRRATDQSITAGVGVMGTDKLSVANSRGEVVVYAQQDGREQWRTPINSEILTSPVGYAGRVLVIGTDNQVYGLSSRDGEVCWKINNTVPALLLRAGGNALITNHQVGYIGLSNGKVIAVDIHSGKKLWETSVSLPHGRSELQRMVDINGQMAVAGDVLYVVTYQGQLAALSTITGRILWQRPMSSYSGLSVHNGYVALSDADDHVWLLSAKDGTTIWKQDALLYRQLTVPVFWHNYLVVADLEGYLHILSIAEGQLVGRKKVGRDGIRVAPRVVDNTLYVSTDAGQLVAYQLRHLQ